MKGFRSSVLVALVLVSALVVIASPAFATPNLTASSGTRNGETAHRAGAVAPFITPSTSTRSMYTGTGDAPDTRLGLPGLALTVSCTRSTAQFYASTTHTVLRVSDLTFSGTCTVNVPRGRVDTNPISCVADPNRPWLVHVTAVAAGSATGTVNTASTCVFVVTLNGPSDTLTVDAGQSCRPNAGGGGNAYTNATQSLVVTCNLTVTSVGAVRGSFTGTFQGTYTVRPPAGGSPLTVTSSS
jgi:hypothetical protein